MLLVLIFVLLRYFQDKKIYLSVLVELPNSYQGFLKCNVKCLCYAATVQTGVVIHK